MRCGSPPSNEGGGGWGGGWGISPFNAIWKILICLGHSVNPLLQMGRMEEWVEKNGTVEKKLILMAK